MRHRRNTQNLSRFSSYYKATIHALTRAVLIHQKIVTTEVRAKLAKRLVDKLITLGKDVDSLAARRRAFSILGDHGLVKRLFLDIAPMFSQKNGGYSRIIFFKRRRGDNASLVVLELSVQKEKKPKPKVVHPEEKKEAPKIAPKPEHKDIAPPEKEKHRKETKKFSPKILGGFEKFFKQKKDSSS